MALTDARLRNARPSSRPFKLADGGGLYIEVRPSGSKLWRYRYRIVGKENVFALGAYPELTLAEARREHIHARELVKQGIHPSHHRQNEKLRRTTESKNTFEAVAREWVEQNKPKWSGYYARQVERVLETDAYPYIGALPIKQITAAHLHEILTRIKKRGASTVAIMARQWFSAIFRYAVSTLRADSDPAIALKGAISRPKVQHHKPLTRTEIPEFLKKLDTFGGYRTTAIALRLLLILFVRPGELRAAEWSEFDLEHAEWRIPPERMKMGELHIVPLPTQAIELLKELQTLTGGRQYLFPNYRRPKTYMTATTLNRAIERMGYAGRFSAHGFRATASTMLNELSCYRPDVIERQLAHKERNAVRASYNQAQYLDERRKMMQEWATHIDALAKGGKVTPIRKPAA